MSLTSYFKTSKNLTFLFIIITLALFSSIDAEAAKITGKVVNKEDNKALPNATVTIHNKKDSSTVTGARTNRDGNYTIDNVPTGNYYLKCSYVSYETYMEDIVVDKSDLKIATINLIPVAVKTEAVQITADREAIQVGFDRKVFKIEQNAATIGSTATDLLENIPSVSVDQEGNVSMRGSSDIQILIDGRPSALTGADALDQIPASMISSIELITNPGSKYDAEGTAGMINIVTIQNKEDGISGLANLSVGTDDDGNMKYNGTFNTSYSVGKFNINANLNGRLDNGASFGNSSRTNYKNGTEASHILTNSTSNSQRKFLSGKLILDYFITPKDMLSYSINIGNRGRYSENSNIFNLTQFITNTNAKYTRDEVFDPNMFNMENALTYKKMFEEKGHELIFDTYYTSFNRKQLIDYTQNNYISPDFKDYTSIFEKSDIDAKTNLLNLQVDYTLPISKDTKFEAGAKFTNRKNDNSVVYEDLTDDIWTKNNYKSDACNYVENIYAAYATFGSTFGNFKYQLGLRSETLVADFNSETVPDKNFSKNYTDLFPSIYLNYEITQNHLLNVNLSKRLQRPRHHALNPFINYEDPLNLRSGNPSLDPEDLYLAELGYMLNYDRTTLNATVFYRYTDKMIQRYSTILAGDTMMTMPYNIASAQNTGFELIFMQRLAKWWKVDANYSFFNSKLDASNIGGLNRDDNMWMLSLNSSMKFENNLQLQLSGRYSSKRILAQGYSEPMWSMDASLRYDFWDNNASLTLRLQDIFNTRSWESYMLEEGVFQSESMRNWNPRRLTLGFSYKFNNYKRYKEKQRDSGAMDDNGEEF